MKTCPACNHQNPVGALVCESCGDRLEISAVWKKTTIRGTHAEAFAAGYLIADRYEIVKEIGQGGMGVVYRVKDTMLQSREMALKMIHPQLVELPEARQRFEQEVNTCLDLLHPNIVRVHNIEEWQGLKFFTMEYIAGRSLQTLVAERKTQKQPFTLSEAASIIIPLLDALAYAHQYTIHRDIKPDNIIVIGDFPEVSVKVLDFGIAKTLSASRFTQTAQVLGTAFYMAPEQMSGGEIDLRADLYSTGMVFYEMITGQMALGRFQLPGEIVAALPKALDGIIEKALASDPEQRFPDADIMSQELKRIVSKSAGEIKATPGIEKLTVPAKTRSKLEQKKEKSSTAPPAFIPTQRQPIAIVKKRIFWTIAAILAFSIGVPIIWNLYQKPTFYHEKATSVEKKAGTSPKKTVSKYDANSRAIDTKALGVQKKKLEMATLMKGIDLKTIIGKWGNQNETMNIEDLGNKLSITMRRPYTGGRLGENLYAKKNVIWNGKNLKFTIHAPSSKGGYDVFYALRLSDQSILSGIKQAEDSPTEIPIKFKRFSYVKKELANISTGLDAAPGSKKDSEIDSRQKLYITDSAKLTLRSGPNSSDKILAIVTSGQKLKIQEKGEQWTKVVTSNGKEGWVLTRYLLQDPDDKYPNYAFVTNRLKLTLRRSPGNNQKIISVLNSGDEVDLIKSGKEWSLIGTKNGLEGWAMSRYLQKHQTEENRLQNYLPLRVEKK